RDEIENFGEEDVLGLLGGSLSQASFDAGGRLKLNWQDERGNSSQLTFAEDMKDKVITYDLGNGAHGAKFGEKLTVTDDTADLVDYYSSGSKEGDGSSLTLRNYGAQGASTFQLADSTWNYDRASGAWSRE
ncbi:MAG: hypothetical protein IIZ54_03400, partial [Selenomonadaceae bacterium]|nr:hypothetical protein [Selenomonadaceae bacterium]